MSRESMAGAISAIEGLAMGYEEAGQTVRAAHLRRIQIILETDLLERDAESAVLPQTLRQRRWRERRQSVDTSVDRASTQASTERRQGVDRRVDQSVDRASTLSTQEPGTDLALKILKHDLRSERESAREHARETSLNSSKIVWRDPETTLAPMPREIDPNLKINAETRAAAEQIGIVEVDVQWQRFVEKTVSKRERSHDHHALFRSRLPFIRNDERRERERDSATRLRMLQNGPVDPGDPYHAPEAVKARQRARDAQHEASKRERAGPQQVGAAVGGLLATLTKKANGGSA